MNIAIIPGRGGSKRIPRKNILPFCGKPIIAHSIETAITSGLFNKVIVSTDDDEIAEVSIRYGAEVPFVRPAELADDHTGTHPVIDHAVRWLIDRGDHVDNVCCLYATAPLVIQDDLRRALEILETGKWESVLAAGEYSSPIFRAFKSTENGGIEMFFPEHYSTRSQDLPVAMYDAGQFYWATADSCITPPKGFHDKSTVITIPSWRAQDIDTFEDWKRAEVIFQMMQDKIKIK